MSNARNLANLLGTGTQITTADIADGAFQANKNLIINGAMQVAQRGTSETGVTTSGYKQAPDRFVLGLSSLGTWTISQSTDAPDGFFNSYKIECTAADASPDSSNYFIFQQRFEGQNFQHLKYGTSSAQSLTLSFWVKSNKTGTYIAEFYQPDGTIRHIDKAYTINSANTWEHKSITFAGDTSGVIDNNNGLGLYVIWWLGAGSNFTSGTLQTSWGSDVTANRAVGNVNLADTIGNDWQITGVQLELGDTATPFEHRSFGDELARCQRYFCRTYEYGTATGTATEKSCLFNSLDAAQGYARTGTFTYPVSMRATPTIVNYNTNNGTAGQISADASNYSGGAGQIGQNRCHIGVSGITIGASVYVKAHATADAEL